MRYDDFDFGHSLRRELPDPEEKMPQENTFARPEISLPARRISEALRPFGISVTETQARQITEYIRLLLRWNRKVSLTTITDPEQILARHFGESLLGALAASIDSGSLLDVGSGAGFPALPIALFFPQVRAVLLEPNVKKAAFLAEACRTLQLTDRIKILRSRLEIYEPVKTRFDFITTRAVRVTPGFLDRCKELLQPGGKLVLWLGQKDSESVFKNRSWVWSEPTKVPSSERRLIVLGTPASGCST